MEAKTITLNSYLIKLTVLFTTTIALFFFATAAIAQSDTSNRSIEVSPPLQEVSSAPGQSIEVKAKVTNKSNGDLSVNVRIDDFVAQGEGGQVALQEKGNVSSWSTLDQNNITLKSGETKEVKATIAIPENAAGGHYGSFVFSAAGESAPNAAGVSQEVASLFLVKVLANINEQVTVEQFSAPAFSQFGPVPFQLRFKNEGNVHVRPYGLIAVTDVFGRKVEDVQFSGENVLPGATRTVESKLDKQFLFGPYKATAILYYGDRNEPLTATTQFFVFPVAIALGVLVLLVLLFLMRNRIFNAGKALGGK